MMQRWYGDDGAMVMMVYRGLWYGRWFDLLLRCDVGCASGCNNDLGIGCESGRWLGAAVVVESHGVVFLVMGCGGGSAAVMFEVI
ncbi:unnamed protein product [Ilex paraguariensis]|uniref:Transmembrane protein n=1 Tax=Ilex paraguariensis TaxID=185542 RepID=A0ABC8TCR2_9AQUA